MNEYGTEITVKEVDTVLSNIENKYSSIKNFPSSNDELEENLSVLSKEFDSIGITPIDFSQPLPKMFEELVCNARSLVQIHRKTLAQMKDTNITSQSNNVKNSYLHKVVENYQTKIDFYENKSATQQNRIEVLEQKVRELRKRETELKNEMEKVKRYHMEQSNDNMRKIKKLLEENRKLKEKESLVTPHSKDEILLKFLAKYRKNEDIYKTTIQELEENNRQLVKKIVEMKCREELN
ncbi:uncharacterized protein LOC130453036 [Diorhabda sublineata]|uniref:uncharacterized protein LOC130453036 n=1 Tax=Diorhabda sublineata TaxID=1163346 RepID=UPI0024E14A5E|nr:uncharacterized protein LOC130453036 [Diorhabda sublineata]